MPFYNVAENGSLRKTAKLNFNDRTRVYLIDGNNIIYIWQGKKASKKKKDMSVIRANKLNEERKSLVKIQVIHQDQEFGGFLAIMDAYKSKGISNGIIEVRPELELEVEDTKELIEAGLKPDLIAEINLAAYELTQKKRDYKELCRELAKLQLSIVKEKGKITENEIKKKSEEILKSSATYEEVCWLISQLNLLSKKNLFKKH